MKLSDLYEEIEEMKKQKSLSKNSEDKLRNALEKMFDVIENFEETGVINKNSTQKIDFLKDTIQAIINYEDEKRIIKGES